MSASMTPTTAFANLREGTGSAFEAEIRTIRAAWITAKDDARKANKARGILEAVLRDIHATSPEHKSQIECAWTAINRVDAG